MLSATKRRRAAHSPVLRWVVPLVAVMPLVAFAGRVHANQPAPERDACTDKRSGAACAVPGGGEGACVEETCYELDYSQGSPPKSVPVACLVCKSGVAPSAEDGGSTPSGLGGSAGDGGTGASAGTDGTDGVPETKSKCSVDERGGDGSWWLLALAGVWLARRRR